MNPTKMQYLHTQRSELHGRQTDPTVCRQTVVLKTLSDPTAQTKVRLGTDHVRPGTTNYWRTPIISSVTFGDLQ